MRDRDLLQSLEKGLLILELLAERGCPEKMESLAHRSQVKKTSCFRVLKTLTHLGFLVRDPESKAYWLGPKAIVIGLAALGGRGIREVALPYLKQLREKTGSTVNLGVLVGADVIFVERLQSDYIMESSLKVGSRLSAHCSSMGKAILAFLSENELESVLEKLILEKKTPNTITSRDHLFRELEEIRRKGFAVNNEELEIGLFAIAGPVRDYTGKAVAAINVSFPLARHTKEEALRTFCPMILETCRNVSFLLGFREGGIF
ncbi:MAG: IclR family transcriptional regulator [Candidatus Methanomethylicaceae archaeon]